MGVLDWFRRPTSQQMRELADRMAAFEAKALGITDLWKAGTEQLAVKDRILSPYEQVGTVYIAIRACSGSVSSVGKLIHETADEDQEPIPEHSLLDTISKSAQPHLRGAQIIDATQTYLESYGTAFWCFDDFRRGGVAAPGEVPHEVFVPEPWQMYADREVPEDPSSPIKTWTYSGRYGARVYSVEQVAFFRFFHPNPRLRFWDGLPPLTAARLDYSLNWRSSRFQEKFYEHGAFPPFYFYTPPEARIDSKERDRAREKFEDEYTGLERAWKPPFLGHGAELRSIAISQRDAEWMGGAKLTRDNILGIFQTPPAVAGFMEDANRANSIEQKRFFWTRTIPPKLDLIRDVVNVDVLDRWWPGQTWKWELAARMAQAIPEDVHEAIASADKMISRGVPPKTAYEFLGLRFDTSDAPWLETGWLPVNQAPAEVLMESGESPEGGEAAVTVARPGEPKSHAERRRRLWKQYETQINGLARSAYGAYRRFLRWWEREVLAAVESAADYPARLANLADLARVLPAESRWVKVLNRSMLPSTTQSISAGYKSLLREIDEEGTISSSEMNRLRGERMQSYRGAVRNLNKRLAELAKDEDPTKAIRDKFDSYAQGQAKVVAGNETAAGFNQARNQAMKDKKIGEHEWLSQRDGAVRESHALADGKRVKLGRKFPHVRIRYPHDPSGPAEETINCRCVTLPVKGKGAGR